MKRMWIGIGLLGLLLATGIVVSWGVVHRHSQLEAQLSEAVEAAMMDDWDSAAKTLGEARENWEHYRSRTAMIADHDPMEEIDSMFSQLQTMYELRDRESFCASGAHLSRLARFMADSQRLTWWNFF